MGQKKIVFGRILLYWANFYVSVLLSISVERFFVSRMRDSFFFFFVGFSINSFKIGGFTLTFWFSFWTIWTKMPSKAKLLDLTRWESSYGNFWVWEWNIKWNTVKKLSKIAIFSQCYTYYFTPTAQNILCWINPFSK